MWNMPSSTGGARIQKDQLFHCPDGQDTGGGVPEFEGSLQWQHQPELLVQPRGWLEPDPSDTEKQPMVWAAPKVLGPVPSETQRCLSVAPKQRDFFNRPSSDPRQPWGTTLPAPAAAWALWPFPSRLNENMLCETVLVPFAPPNAHPQPQVDPSWRLLLSQTLKWASPAGTPAKENAVFEMFLALFSRGANRTLELLTSPKERPAAAASGMNCPNGRPPWNLKRLNPHHREPAHHPGLAQWWFLGGTFPEGGWLGLVPPPPGGQTDKVGSSEVSGGHLVQPPPPEDRCEFHRPAESIRVQTADHVLPVRWRAVGTGLQQPLWWDCLQCG